MLRNLPKILIEDAPLAICMLDTDMRYIAASKKWLEDYGLVGQKYLGISHYDIFPEITDEWKQIHQDCLKGATNQRDEAKFIRANGATQWIKWDVRPWHMGNGDIGGLLMYTEDITQRKKTEELLLETNRVARVGGWEVDLVNKRVMWTTVTREIHEVSEEYVPDITSAIAFFKEGHSRDTIYKLIRAGITHGTPCDEELMLVTASGKEIWVEIKGKAEMVNGRCVRLVGTYQDIHGRKMAESVYQETLARLSLATQASEIGIWEYNPQTSELVWDDQMYKLYGRQRSQTEPIYTLWASAVHPDDAERANNDIQLALLGEKEFNLEFRVVHPDNSVHYIRALAKVQRNANGGPIKMIGTNWDITATKLVEEKLKQSEESFRGAFQHSAVGMALVGPSGNWLRVNASLCKIVGYSESELLASNFKDITHPDDLNTDLKLLQELVEGKRESYQMEKRYFHKNGSVIWVLLSVSMVQDEKGTPLYFISQIRDITEKKHTEDDLQKTLSQLQGILNSTTQVSIIGTDINGIITIFNAGAENLLGYKASEMINKLSPAVIHKPVEIEKRSKELSREFGKEITGFDVFVTHARQGKPDSREWTYVRKDGAEFPVHLVITAVKDKNNSIIGFIGIAVDISKLKEVETELQALIKVTSEQNDRLMNFAHIVSHNLRSHSGNISMLLDFLEAEEDEEEKTQLNQHLKTASKQLSDTIAHLNEVVAVTTSIQENLEIVTLKEVIQNALNNVNALVREHQISVEVDVSDDIKVSGIPAYIESVLLNFITNAIKYRSPKRAPILRIKAEKQSPYILLSVEDNGLGIDMASHGHKIFGMYKTFHGNKDARGIGLFISKNQIEAMGGKVEVESEVDKGTTFSLYFVEK